MLEIGCFKAKKKEADFFIIAWNLAVLLVSGRMMDGVLDQ